VKWNIVKPPGELIKCFSTKKIMIFENKITNNKTNKTSLINIYQIIYKNTTKIYLKNKEVLFFFCAHFKWQINGFAGLNSNHLIIFYKYLSNFKIRLCLQLSGNIFFLFHILQGYLLIYTYTIYRIHILCKIYIVG